MYWRAVVNGRDLEQLKAVHGLLFQGVKCENVPNGNLECTYGKAVVLISLARMGRH